MDPRKAKGPYIIVSNHASRLDYIYTGIPLLPHRLNYVAGYNEFFRSHLAFIFRLLQIIPKQNFTADIYTITQIKRIVKKGGKIALFPEGMSSISGANQPVAIGTGKLLKHLGIPVYVIKLKGAYLTSTKYCLDERPGKVEVEIDQLFTPEGLTQLSDAEVAHQVDAAIWHDDYAWNQKANIDYHGAGSMAKDMETLLYWCPRCHEEHVMKSEGDMLVCTHCGNGARLTEKYAWIPLDERCVIPETPRAWFDAQRAVVREQVADPHFAMSVAVDLGILPEHHYLKDQKTSEIVGKGTIYLDQSGFRYEGTKDGLPFTFHLPSAELPTYGMCTDITRFYTFFEHQFYEFYPAKNIVMKWFIATEEIHRINGGKWQATDIVAPSEPINK